MEQLPGDALERRADQGRAPRTNAIRLDAARAQGLAEAQTQIDVATFIQWVDAYAQDETELTTFYFKRFRDEFKPAVNAWIATRPLKTEGAPLTPFAMPEYKLAATADAERLDAEAEASAAIVRETIQRASNYVLGVVLFAVALFFAGMSTKLGVHRLRVDHARDRLRALPGHGDLDRHVPGQPRGLSTVGASCPRSSRSPATASAPRSSPPRSSS